MDPVDFLVMMADRYDVLDICKTVLYERRFPLWSGSSREFQHHYGKGGLSRHLVEVVKLCLANNDLLGKPIDEKRLFLAAFFHDVGKMWDYTPLDTEYKQWAGTEHKRNIHHISRSALVWQQCSLTLPMEFVDDVLHAILSHHGQREHGSPVYPNTKLAWMVHLCDGISARMNDSGKWDRIKESER